MKLDLSHEAEAGLERIADYIARDNPRRARSLVTELIEACCRLLHAPFRYPLMPRREDTGVRRCPHGRYLIFYRVGDERIEVLNILHGAMDYEPIVFPPP